MNRAPAISVIDPLGPAVERVREVLFRPFDLGRWVSIGFCAWLAGLGRAGAGGGGTHWNVSGGRGGDLRRESRRAVEYVLENLHWIIPLAAAVLLIAVGVWVLLAWLSSRGRFMFLHGVTTGRAEVQYPWNRYAALADSLFRFRLWMGLAISLVVFPVGLAGGGLSLWLLAEGGSTPAMVLAAGGTILVITVLAVIAGVVHKLTVDFVVPVMWLRSVPWRPAWQEVAGLVFGHKLDLVLYLLFQAVLSVVVGMAVLLLVVVTCCVAGCLLAIPFLGTVVFLPVLVFDRAYSLHYLGQFGEDYRMLWAGGQPG